MGCKGWRNASLVISTICVVGLVAAVQAQRGPNSRLAPYLLPGCTIMFEPGAACTPKPTPADVGCCPAGFSCGADPGGPPGRTICVEKPASRQSFAAAALALAAGSCERKALPGETCGGAAGPDPGACCPDGFACTAAAAAGALGPPDKFTCQPNVAAPATAAAAASAGARLPYPAPAMAADACACRVDKDGARVPRPCPSPWDHAAGVTRVPPRLAVDAKGNLLRAAPAGGKPAPAALRGVNWFGWEGGQHNFDGLWAYCDDNSTQPGTNGTLCIQDGEVPPSTWPSPAIGNDGQFKTQLYFWKRRMTGDFATVAWRLRLLGFNAVRVAFTFDALADSMANYSAFTACANDPDDYIALNKTLDPEFLSSRPRGANANLQLPGSLAYAGVPHPPPPAAGDPAACGLPWSAPFLDSYQSATARAEYGSEFKLTMCNWYLPQGPGALGIHRLLWQVQYLVSQGFYVLLDYHPVADKDPNVQDPALLAANWGALWGALRDLPQYSSLLAGRVVADLVNEASKYGCQWDRECSTCAKGADIINAAAAAIRAVDPQALISTSGMGQDGSGGCAGAYPGMNWGDGFITAAATVAKYGLGDASFLFKYSPADESARQRLLAPHDYPSSITGLPPQYDAAAAARTRWGLSWGNTARGTNKLSNGSKAPRTTALLGEFGVRDTGNNEDTNADTTVWSPSDVQWLSTLSGFSRSSLGPSGSWLVWAWNANSGDTRGIVGPRTTWREVQWTKVRALARGFGLRPWYCDAAPKAWAKKYGCK